MSSSRVTLLLCCSVALGAVVAGVLIAAGYYYQLAHGDTTTTSMTTAIPASTSHACEPEMCRLIGSLSRDEQCSVGRGLPRLALACVERSLEPICVVGECRYDSLDEQGRCIVVDDAPLTFTCDCHCHRSNDDSS